MEKSEVKNYYEVLEIPISSNQQEVQEGYLRTKHAYSQESPALYSLMTAQECEDILTLVEEAYSILGDPTKRKQYDEARGFLSETAGSVTPEPKFEKKPEPPKETTSNRITKLVSNKRYQLDFEVNASFEQEIEETNEYTGDLLKKIREYKNVDIIRMADMTKVSKTYIKNIEEENLTNLPALVYVRGFVYQYAKCLKLNPNVVATSYLNRLKRLKASDNAQ